MRLRLAYPLQLCLRAIQGSQVRYMMYWPGMDAYGHAPRSNNNNGLSVGNNVDRADQLYEVKQMKLLPNPNPNLTHLWCSGVHHNISEIKTAFVATSQSSFPRTRATFWDLGAATDDEELSSMVEVGSITSRQAGPAEGKASPSQSSSGREMAPR